jgi:hypothetical protein
MLRFVRLWPIAVAVLSSSCVLSYDPTEPHAGRTGAGQPASGAAGASAGSQGDAAAASGGSAPSVAGGASGLAGASGAGGEHGDGSANDSGTGDAGKSGASGAGGGAENGAGGGADGGVVLTPQQKRGHYLVTAVIACSDCHTPRNPDGRFDVTKFLAGETTPAPACIFLNKTTGECLHPSNLTNDRTGLTSRTDAEIKKMITEGIRPAATGSEPLHPLMPYYVFGNMADADADAIVAYLRTVPGVVNAIPRRGASWDIPRPASKLNVANLPATADAYPQKADAVRGKYLATQAGLCVECHTKHLVPGPGVATVLDESKIFWGGEDFSGILGPTFTSPIVSKNLTPDPTTGLGNWSIDDIVKAVTQGRDKMDKGICPPMPASQMGAYGHLTPGDASDIAHYLKSIAPAVNMINDMCVFPPGRVN